MAQVELIMPKMGESIMEATILKWVKKVGDAVEADETILEIATDKVDSEVPSPVSGVISKIFFEEDTTVEIGKVIALIATEGEEAAPSESTTPAQTAVPQKEVAEAKEAVASVAATSTSLDRTSSSGRFYSPLVRNIAEKENISLNELEQIAGSGLQGRVTKKDILAYIENRTTPSVAVTPAPTTTPTPPTKKETPKASPSFTPAAVSLNGNTEIVEMDRMRRLRADHMVISKKTSPHVTSFV